MVYIYNTNLSGDIAISIALTQLVGIGKKLALQICDEIGVSQNINLRKLSASQLYQLNQILHQNYYIAAELRALIKTNQNRLSSISSYRGFRYIQKLPCRGQRTHGNARTSRKQPTSTKLGNR